MATLGNTRLDEIQTRHIQVVYHLNGQTGRSMVWANGSQNSGLVNFVPESRLLFVQISSIYRKTTAKARYWYQRWLWRNETWISFWSIPSWKTGLPLQMFCCSRKFSAGTTKKVMFHLPSNQIFRNLFVNGKQPHTPPKRALFIYFTLFRLRVSLKFLLKFLLLMIREALSHNKGGYVKKLKWCRLVLLSTDRLCSWHHFIKVV